jgi:hypothetical protein
LHFAFLAASDYTPNRLYWKRFSNSSIPSNSADTQEEVSRVATKAGQPVRATTHPADESGIVEALVPIPPSRREFDECGLRLPMICGSLDESVDCNFPTQGIRCTHPAHMIQLI